jgi:hypothetical protein
MRTRDNIKLDFNKYDSLKNQNGLILETLLDIRDLLANPLNVYTRPDVTHNELDS